MDLGVTGRVVHNWLRLQRGHWVMWLAIGVVAVTGCSTPSVPQYPSGTAKQPVPGNQEAAHRYEAMRYAVNAATIASAPMGAYDAPDVQALNKQLEHLKRQISQLHDMPVGDPRAMAPLLSSSAAEPVLGGATVLPGASSAAGSVARWQLQLQDVTVYAAFSRWAKTAGWRVLWDADKHLLIDTPDVISGDFEQALAAVVGSPSVANGSYPLEVCFYPNTPPLARITKRGEQAKDCK